MGWSIGYDTTWKRDIGYGVPSTCDHPGCGKKIDRGLAYVCGGEPYGGDSGCGLYFCGKHLHLSSSGPLRCKRCVQDKPPFEPTPDRPEWIHHKLTDESWQQWRAENPEEVAALVANALGNRLRAHRMQTGRRIMSDHDAKPKADGAESLSTAGLERMFRAEKFDHPDLVGGIVWADCELAWINERITLAILAEREACAATCEDLAMEYRRDHDPMSENVADECYGRILARSNAQVTGAPPTDASKGEES